MEVGSEDQRFSFTTMASLVRIVDLEQARFGDVKPGVSYQFLPSDEATRESIARTVRHIAEQHPEQAGDLVPEEFQEAAADGAYPGAEQIKLPSVETGATVRLIVPAAGGGKREVEGIVGDITESVQGDGETRFWIPVFLTEEIGDVEEDAETSQGDDAVEVDSIAAEPIAASEAPAEPEVEGAGDDNSLLDRMWKELVPEARSIIGMDDAEMNASPTGTSHLSGRLSQISMPSALWLLDQERLTGMLEFRREGEQVTLYLVEGRVIDAESPDSERDPRGHLSALMAWKDGDFVFRVAEVMREDKIGVPTQGLLLDLAVAQDEEGR
jgi:hypothetical protein